MPELPPKLESYYGRPTPKLGDLDIRRCYLCGKLLGDVENTDKDHIIPQKLFASGSAHKPYLPVHKQCNRTKSLRDEKFALLLAVSAHRMSAAADAMMSGFLTKVNEQRPNAYLVGQGHKLRDYKLSRTIAKGISAPRLMVGSGSNAAVEVDIGDRNATERDEYVAKMVKGLLVRQVKGIQPTQPQLSWFDYQSLHNQGRLKSTLDEMAELRKAALFDPHGFGQLWPGHVSYAGVVFDNKPFQGFIYVEFFRSVGVYAVFPASDEPESPTRPSLTSM